MLCCLLHCRPETSIGFYPDVGGSFFLPRLPKRFGHYLGLTGDRLKGADVLHAGIATHYIPSDKLPSFEVELQGALDDAANAAKRQLTPKEALEVVTAVADRHAVRQDALPSFPLTSEALSFIDWAFSQPTVEGVIASLNSQLSVTPSTVPPAKGTSQDIAARSLETFSRVCPLSLKVTHEQLRRGAELSLAQCFQMELRMSLHMLKLPDFYEGVRALLVDRDNKPRWSPATLAGVSDEQVQAIFAPLGEGRELQLR